MQLLESGLMVKEYELLRKNFSEIGCFGFGIQETLILELSMILQRVSMSRFLKTDSKTETESETKTVGSSHLTDMPRPTACGVQPVPQLEGCHYGATGKDNSM
ncbi:60S ribosomal protein L11 [Capsicum chinense]|nr:60S ribosomal protein L11 [Capsicum chinense]